ncbi:MAG: DUF3147 family protein [Verrucomicrobiales bacterium]
MCYFMKVVVSAVIIVTVSEVSKRTTTWGGMIASLPLVSILGMTWLYLDTRDSAKVAGLAGNTLWFVLPSLILFILFPLLIKAGKPFWMSMVFSILATGLGYLLTASILKKFGVNL